jgi:hypothetical protein
VHARRLAAALRVRSNAANRAGRMRCTKTTTPLIVFFFVPIHASTRIPNCAIPAVIAVRSSSSISLVSATVAVDALADYGVYLNLPKKAKTEWLAAKINAALAPPLSSELLYMVGQGLQEEIGWWGLVDPAIKQVVKTEGFLHAP